jgi:hypothetical protein
LVFRTPFSFLKGIQNTTEHICRWLNMLLLIKLNYNVCGAFNNYNLTQKGGSYRINIQNIPLGDGDSLQK